MSNEPGSPTVEDKLAELEKLRADVEAERQAMVAQRAQTEELNNTMSSLAAAIAQQNAPAEPQYEDDPMPEDYDERTLQAAATMTKRALREYHNGIAPAIENLRSGQFESEWDRVRSQDPKNFDRMKNQMRKYFDDNPGAKQPGALANLFVQMRGTHFQKLQEMDAAERAAALNTPTPDPSPLSAPKAGKADNATTFNEDELRIIRGMQGAVHPEDYYLGRYGEKPNFPEGYLAGLGFEPKGAE